MAGRVLEAGGAVVAGEAVSSVGANAASGGAKSRGKVEGLWGISLGVCVCV